MKSTKLAGLLIFESNLFHLIRNDGKKLFQNAVTFLFVLRGKGKEDKGKGGGGLNLFIGQM